MEKIKLFFNFIIENRFLIALIILFIMLIIQLFLMIPLINKFREMETIPLGEAESESRFNELNNNKNISPSSVSDYENISSDL